MVECRREVKGETMTQQTRIDFMRRLVSGAPRKVFFVHCA